MISVRSSRASAIPFPACPYCRSAVMIADSVVRCYSCSTLHHAACWRENRNRCSVFHCNAAQVFPATEKQTASNNRTMLLVALHTTLNIVIHFFINAFAPFVYSLHIQDALIVGTIETCVLTSGAVLLLRLRSAGFQWSESPLIVFAPIILGWNVAFVCSLIWYWLSNGLPALFALIRL